jgi:hypothetical protein
MLPAGRRWELEPGVARSLSANHARVSRHTGPHATRCAPRSLEVRGELAEVGDDALGRRMHRRRAYDEASCAVSTANARRVQASRYSKSTLSVVSVGWW